MGGTSSKSKVENIINAGTDIINQLSSLCVTQLTETQGFDITGCTNVLYDGDNFTQFGTIKTGCTASQAADTKTQTDIAEAIKNAASAAQDTLIPKADETTANAYTKASTDLSTAVTNAFSQDCSSDENLNQVTSCTDSEGIQILNVNFTQYGKDQVHCVQDAVGVTAASIKLSDIIDNAAKATATDPFADLIKGLTNPFFLFGALLVVGLFILAPLFGGEVIVVDMVKSPFFWGAVVIIVPLLILFVF